MFKIFYLLILVALILSCKNGLGPEEIWGLGSIEVKSTPQGADVYLDGGLTGKKTNCVLDGVYVGTHLIKLTLPNYYDWDTTVTVIANQTITVNAYLLKRWQCATESAGWSPRRNHTSVVFDNKMWVLGGWDYSGYRNDVWYSSDGINWVCATESAGWSPREGHTSVVFDNKIWVLGGYDGDDFRNDVWYSSDGINWVCATESARWPPREDHTSVVFDNKMWVLGGLYYADFRNDVWYSSDGINWVCATESADWSPRDNHTSVVFDNKMWVLGGYDDSGYKNDVWY
jgi:hypothetical protein